MRNLEEWTRYLDEQEQALQRKSRPAPIEPAIPVRESVLMPKIGVSAAPKPEAKTDARSRDAVQPRKMPKLIEQAPLEDTEALSVESAIRMRKNLPQQLLTVDIKQPEITQNSYKGFKESREEFLRRLLDPALTLEEAARVLNVCPTTVRRYTNKGLLNHFRTPGNQRRFRLSEVLSFMESNAATDMDI